MKKYQLSLSETEDIEFSLKWISRARHNGNDICINPDGTNNITEPFKHVVLSVDLSAGTRRAKYTVLLVIGYTKNGTRIPIWMDRGKYKYPDIKRLMVDIWDKHSCNPVVVESNAFQMALVQDMKTESAIFKERGLSNTMNVQSSFTSGKNKNDPEFGVSALTGLFDNDLVAIPDGNEFATQMFRPLFTELKTYPGATTDVVMAWWINENYMRPKVGTTGLMHVDTVRHQSVTEEKGTLIQSLLRAASRRTDARTYRQPQRPRRRSAGFRTIQLPVR